MSTTVIASRLGPRLYLAPWLPTSVDVAAVRRVAAEHGVDLFDAAQLNTRLEVIAAVGLEPARAAGFASALREQGLTVRVVNDVSIQRSARLATALALQILVAAVTLPLILPALLALANALYIGLGGTNLPVIGTASAADAPGVRVLQRLRALKEELPAHVLDPILAKAEELSRAAATAPDGPAAQALEELLSDLEDDHAAETEHAARSLRQQLAHARRAARELG